MDKILDIARHVYPLSYIILFFISFLLAVIYWSVYFTHKVHSTVFTGKFIEVISKKIHIGVIISVIIVLSLLIFPFTGYPKKFKVIVQDGNNNSIDRYKLYIGKKTYNSPDNIWLNNTDLPTNIKVDYQALFDSKDIDIDYFIKSHSIGFNLDKNTTSISFDKLKRGFKHGNGKKIIYDNGGADLYTTENAIDSYLIIDNNTIKNVNNFELVLNALIYDNNASLTVDIGGSLRILFGEGNFKTLKIETNLSRKPYDWNKHSTHEIEFDVERSKPFRLSVAFTNNIDSTTDLLINIYYNKYVSNSLLIKSVPVTVNKNSTFKIGCINRKRVKSVRLIDMEINSSKPRK